MILRFISRQAQKILALEGKHSVQITINKTVGEIKVNGNPDGVTNAASEVYEIILEHKTETANQRDNEALELLGQKVMFYYKDKF